MRIAIAPAAAIASATPAQAGASRLRRPATTSQPVVDGKPMLRIAGGLRNSAASSAADMAPHWAKPRAMRRNSVREPVPWEPIEPVEGRYDRPGIDARLRDARAADLTLGPLWFGGYEHSMSTDVPGWVKRFPRAYAAMLAELKAADPNHDTVVMR